MLPANVGPVPIRSATQQVILNRHALKAVFAVNQQVISSSSLLFAQVCHVFVALLSLRLSLFLKKAWLCTFLFIFMTVDDEDVRGEC